MAAGSPPGLTQRPFLSPPDMSLPLPRSTRPAADQDGAGHPCPCTPPLCGPAALRYACAGKKGVLTQPTPYLVPLCLTTITYAPYLYSPPPLSLLQHFRQKASCTWCWSFFVAVISSLDSPRRSCSLKKTSSSTSRSWPWRWTTCTWWASSTETSSQRSEEDLCDLVVVM